tara:strand:- start:1737 stop:2873 length:1137 start_codon:yes stop_codon:yes gene_type:complete
MKISKALLGSTALLAAFVSAGTQAAEKRDVSAAVTALSAADLDIGASFDMSYDWAANDTTVGRTFRTENDGFVMHQVNIRGGAQWSNGIGAHVNVVLGNDANVISGNGEDDDFDLTQAYLSKTHGNLSVMGGRFVTLAGMEVINPTDNLNATRSFLFGFQPFVHTGVRATYALGDMWTFTAGVNNAQFANTGNSMAGDNNTDTTFEAQVGYTPFDSLSMFLTGYTGNEDAGDRAQTPGTVNDADLRFDTLDLVVNYQALPQLYVGLNADYFNSEDPTGGSSEAVGVASYLNYQFNSKLRAAYRNEYLELKDAGAGSGSDILRSNTLTLGYSCIENFEIALEARHDKATGDAGAAPFAPIDMFAEDDQITGTLRTTFKF